MVIAMINGMKTKEEVKKILDAEMKRVSHNLDNNIMDRLSLNIVREKCVKSGVFDTPFHSLKWTHDNSSWLNRVFGQLNRRYRLPK